MVQKRRAEEMVKPNAVIVSDEGMAKGTTVEWRRKVWGAIDRFLIALAEGKEEFISFRETMVNPHCPGGIQDRIDSRKVKVVDKQILVRRRGLRGQRQNVLCHGANRNRVVCKRLTTLHPSYGLSCGGIEDLTLQNWVEAVTGIENRVAHGILKRWPQKRRKIPLPFLVSRDRTEVG